MAYENPLDIIESVAHAAELASWGATRQAMSLVLPDLNEILPTRRHVPPEMRFDAFWPADQLPREFISNVEGGLAHSELGAVYCCHISSDGWPREPANPRDQADLILLIEDEEITDSTTHTDDEGEEYEEESKSYTTRRLIVVSPRCVILTTETCDEYSDDDYDSEAEITIYLGDDPQQMQQLIRRVGQEFFEAQAADIDQELSLIFKAAYCPADKLPQPAKRLQP